MLLAYVPLFYRESLWLTTSFLSADAHRCCADAIVATAPLASLQAGMCIRGMIMRGLCDGWGRLYSARYQP